MARPTRHRTLVAHVPEGLWQTAHYQALVNEVSVSDLVREAVQHYLESRGTVISTYEQLVGQTSIDLENLRARNDA